MRARGRLRLSGALARVEERFGSEVRLTTGNVGELVATPPGTILAARGLHPGAEAHGSRGEVRLFNPAEVPLTVQPIIAPAPSDLERIVPVSIRAGDRKVFEGPLTELRGGAARSFRLRPRQRQRLSFAGGSLPRWGPSGKRHRPSRAGWSSAPGSRRPEKPRLLRRKVQAVAGRARPPWPLRVR